MLGEKVLFVVVLRADKTISGLAYRLLSTAKHFYDNNQKGKLYIISTVSLWEKCYPNVSVDKKYIKLVDDRKWYKLKMLLLWLYSLQLMLLNNIKILHTNGTHILLPIHYLKKFFKYRTVVTFGSASLEMASGNSVKVYKRWKAVLNAASAVDVLNPVNSIDGFNSKKYVSPCSFPSNLPLLETYAAHIIKRDIITFAGSFSSQKNPLLAIDGFEQFLRYSNLHSLPSLHIFGKGVLFDEIHQRMLKINKEFGKNTIVLHTNEADLFSILAQSRIFFSLQDFTNYPSQSLIEAMFLGNDILATNFGDTDRIVLEKNRNILIHHKDPEAVKLGLEKLFANPATFNKLNAGFIRNNHNIESFTSYLSRLYSEI